MSPTDPEARQMMTRHGVDVRCNCHVAVEAGNHFIVSYIVDKDANDYGSVVPLARGSKGPLGEIEISADRGHFSLQNLKALSELGMKAYIPSARRGRPDRRDRDPGTGVGAQQG
ncbi:MAG: hypothetical protein ACP5G6_06450 [Conexivisphaera sp.]|nr:transposase [Conexivisphaerales archaeon]